MSSCSRYWVLLQYWYLLLMSKIYNIFIEYYHTVTVTEALVLHSLLEDRGRITESVYILVPVDRMKEKCFQIMTKRVCWSQQFQLRRQPVPCSRCSNREGSVANLSTCPQQDEVATRWSMQCRSTWNIGDRCQNVWDIFWHVPEATCEPASTAIDRMALKAYWLLAIINWD